MKKVLLIGLNLLAFNVSMGQTAAEKQPARKATAKQIDNKLILKGQTATTVQGKTNHQSSPVKAQPAQPATRKEVGVKKEAAVIEEKKK